MQDKTTDQPSVQETNAVAEWRSWLTSLSAGFLLFETLTGLAIWLLPFSEFTQFSVLLHTAIGIVLLLPVIWYTARHWWVRRKGNLSHYQLLGYIAAALLAVCVASGFVVTWQGFAGPRMDYGWKLVHLITGIGLAVFIVVHVVTVVVRKVNNPDARRQLLTARRAFYVRSLASCVCLLALCGLWTLAYSEPNADRSFPEDYNWRFGEDRPFAPSMARVDQSQWTKSVHQQIADVVGDQHREVVLASLQENANAPNGLFKQVHACTTDLALDDDQRQKLAGILSGAAAKVKKNGAVHAKNLAGSESCGTSGCHTQIYEEWLPSAHRYSSMDDMFQRVQELMSHETSPEHTRYCAGCHDPISLFSGAKNSGNITLSVLGADEGISCIVCHSVVQTDVQGNGDYTIQPPRRYVYEQHEGKFAKLVSDFLIRTYPRHHITSYSRPLYKTAEFCGACHKQYLDKEVNTDIGKVQGQNQYDSWKNSKWYHEGDATKTINCRECHMPLTDSDDPARGDVTDYNRRPDDAVHRSHRTLASNQYIPALMNLPGHERHVALTKKWLRGEIEIPEIADKWATGPVVRLSIVAPDEVAPGEQLSLQVILTNNKTGHDFPTGPLDMLESWIELKVTDAADNIIYHSGDVDEDGEIMDTQVWFKADGFDRQRKLIDRHNLWDLVGASYKRTLYPGVTDSVAVQFQCPSMARGRLLPGDGKPAPGKRSQKFSVPTPAETENTELTVEAVLWYRKANPEFLDRVYGKSTGVRSPISEMTRATTHIGINGDDATPSE